jgi:antibiotic biosynthesis monooxygenase (ABM) superfamily enzyme
MITRIWRGWTSQHNAQAYQDLLINEIFPGIAARQIPGYQGLSLIRRDVDNEVEFTTIMWFDSLDAVKTFAGPNYETAVVPVKARAVLARFDTTSAHFDTIVPPPNWKAAG